MTLTTQIHIFNVKNETAESIWKFVASCANFPFEKYYPEFENEKLIVFSPMCVGAKAWVKVEKEASSGHFSVCLDSTYASSPEQTHNEIIAQISYQYQQAIILSKNEYSGEWVTGRAPYDI